MPNVDFTRTSIRIMIPMLNKINKMLITELQKELRDQGHDLTGELSATMKGIVEQNSLLLTAGVVGKEHGKWVQFATDKSDIPFGNKSSDHSEYIQGLIDFFQAKGFTEKKAAPLAFATARVHVEEGRPSLGSKAYSNTGSRTGFISEVVERNKDKVSDMLLYAFGFSVADVIKQMKRNYPELNKR